MFICSKCLSGKTNLWYGVRIDPIATRGSRKPSRADLEAVDPLVEVVGVLDGCHRPETAPQSVVRPRRKFSLPQSLDNSQNAERISICVSPPRKQPESAHAG